MPSVFATNALAAGSWATRFAMTVLQRAPRPDPADPKAMGLVYDVWLATLAQQAREFSGAVDALESSLPKGPLMEAYRHFKGLVQHLHNSFEGSWQYRAPFSSNKTFGMVWSTHDDDTRWFKRMVRMVHRAQAMQLLTALFVKLEFALLMAHVSDSQGTDLLGPEFEVKYQDGMQQMHRFLEGIQGPFGPADPPAGGLNPRFAVGMDRDDCITWIGNFLEEGDMTEAQLREFILACGDDHAQLFQHAEMDLLQAGLGRVAGGAPGAVNLANYLNAVPPQPYFQVPNLDPIPGFWWTLEWADWWDPYQDYMNHVMSFETGGNNAAGAVSNQGDVDNARTALDAVAARRVAATVHRMRFQALSVLMLATGRYGNPNHERQVMSYTSETFFSTMSVYDNAQLVSIGFRPEFVASDERERLQAMLDRRTVYTSLFFRFDQPVMGQFILRERLRGMALTRRLVVHEWQQELKFETEDLHAWVLTHLEAPLMADLLFIAGPVMLANHQARADGLTPTPQIHALMTRAFSRFDLMQALNDEDGELRNIERQNNFFFGNNAHVPKAIRAKFEACYNGLKALKDPVAIVSHTTEPMTRQYRVWFNRVVELFDALQAQPAGGALGPAVPLPLHGVETHVTHNALTHSSYRAIPQGNVENPVDTEGNVVWRRPLPLMAWTAVKTYTENAVRAKAGHDVMASYTVSGQFLRHMGPSLKELMKKLTVLHPFYVLGLPNQNHMELVINDPRAGAGAPPHNPGGVPHQIDGTGIYNYIGPSSRNLINELELPDAQVFVLNYITPQRSVDRVQALLDAFEKAYREKLPPFTYPGHWLTTNNDALIQNRGWRLVEDNEEPDLGGILIDYRALARQPRRVVPAADQAAGDHLYANY